MKNLLMAVAVGASALGAYADYTPTWRGLPNGYTQVEYVEANGTQYVDLGVNAQSGLSMETDMLWTALPSDGGYCSAKSAAGKWIMPLWYYNGSWMFGYGNYFSTQVPATANTLYHVESALRDGLQTATITDGDGNVVLDWSNNPAATGDLDLGITLYLFANHTGTSVGGQSKSRCYALKIWRDNADGGRDFVGDFVPCKTDAGDTGLFNLASNQFLKASAALTCGAAVYGEGVTVEGDPGAYQSGGSPDYGFVPKSAGDAVRMTAPEYVELADGERVVCAGWKLYDAVTGDPVGESEDETRCVCAFPYEKPVRLVWQWTIEHLVRVTAAAGLTVEPTEAWVDDGQEVTISMSGASRPLWRVNGETQESRTSSLTVSVSSALSISALDVPMLYAASDGAGSGASWTDAASITTAFAAVAEAGCGEVWLKEGWYDLTAGFALSSDVIVRGGFAGTETSADEADPKAHRTVLSAIVDASRYSWSSNAGRTVNCPLWKDGEFNLCRPTDEDGCIWRAPAIITGLNGAQTGAVGFANIFTMPAGSTGVKVSGVVLTGSRGNAIIVSESSSIEVESCRFLACGVGTGGVTGGGISANGLVSVKDCDFIGCGGAPLTLGGTDTTVSHKVVNCLFDDNIGCSSTSRSAAIDVSSKTPVEIEGCTFRSNIGLARCASSFAGSVIANASSAAMTIKNCLFEDNRCRTSAPTGSEAGNMPFGCIHAKGTVTIEGCMFRGNNVKGANLDYAQGRTACIAANGNLIIRNTVFAGNWISATTAKATTWSIVACGASSTGRFINCAFYDNEVCVEGTTEAAKDGMWSTTLGLGRLGNGSDTSYGVTLLNCLFSNNKLASNVTIPEEGTPRQAEVMLLDDSNLNRPGYTYSLINTVIWNKSADHRSFREHPEINPWITHCDFVNCGDVEARTNGTTCIEYLTADDPGISPKVCRKRGTYPFKGMLGLALDSPFVKSGTPVYEKDGTFYIYEPGVVANKPWRHCTLKGTSYASLAAGAAPVADGFGAAREEDAFSYGPIVNVPFGLAVMLR